MWSDTSERTTRTTCFPSSISGRLTPPTGCPSRTTMTIRWGSSGFSASVVVGASSVVPSSVSVSVSSVVVCAAAVGSASSSSSGRRTTKSTTARTTTPPASASLLHRVIGSLRVQLVWGRAARHLASQRESADEDAAVLGGAREEGEPIPPELLVLEHGRLRRGVRKREVDRAWGHVRPRLEPLQRDPAGHALLGHLRGERPQVVEPQEDVPAHPVVPRPVEPQHQVSSARASRARSTSSAVL